jgi:acetyltransferase
MEVRIRQTKMAAMTAVDYRRSRADVALATRLDMIEKRVSRASFEPILRYAEAQRETVEAIKSTDHEAAIRMERETGAVATGDTDDPTVRVARKTLAGSSYKAHKGDGT